MRARLIGAATVIAALASLGPAGVAYLHHTTVRCARPGVWEVENSEGIPATFTTDRGHTGTLGPREVLEVAYSGTSLTVTATWINGVTATNTGTGQCTTTTTTSTTTTTTTPTTLPPSTTTSSSTSSVPPSTPPSVPSTPPSEPPATPSPPTSTPRPSPTMPPTIGPRPSVPTSVPSSDCETATFDPADPDAGVCFRLVSTL